MIIDELAQKSHWIRDFCVDAQIVRVPMQIYPWDDSDGIPGLLWSGDTSFDPKSDRFPIDCSLARPPFDKMVFFSEHSEPGMLLCRVQGVIDYNQGLVDIAKQFGKDDNRYIMADQYHIVVNIWLVGRSSKSDTLFVRYIDAVYWRNGAVSLFPHHLNMLLDEAETMKYYANRPDIIEVAVVLQEALTIHWMAVVNNRAYEGDLDKTMKQIIKHGGFKMVEKMYGGLSLWVRNFSVDSTNMYCAVVSACALLHCRNVVTEIVRPDSRLQTARLRRGKHLAYEYKQMRVRVGGLIRSIIHGASLNGQTTAVHWRRGHFKSYSALRPLFGNRIGSWWWQPVLSGKNEKSFVDKQYMA